MCNSVKSILIIFIIIIIQLSNYDLFLKSIITTWGASNKEISMPMVGDGKSLVTASTRAIVINASKSAVWKWLMQLGADRGGFFSYGFIENTLGYKTRYPNLTKPKFKEMKVGNIIRGSMDEKSNIIPYNFKVLTIKPQASFVLENWGTFLLEKVNQYQTRLIIRTRVAKNTTLRSKMIEAIIIPFHYIMERGTLLGIKARVETETGIPLSHMSDIVWFWGIILSGLLIGFLIFIGRGIIQSFIIPLAFSTFYLCSLLLFNPVPPYTITLLFIISMTIIWIVLTRSKTKKKSHLSL